MIPETIPAIVILNESSFLIAQKIQQVLPGAEIYGLDKRCRSSDRPYSDFGETVRGLFTDRRPILGLCAAGILIRTIAPLLNSKWQEPPILAIAEDGSAVVPLLGGLQGVNELARRVAEGLNSTPAITTSGDLRFRAALLSPPPGYELLNPEDAKTFIADLLAGETVKIIDKTVDHSVSSSDSQTIGETVNQTSSETVESAHWLLTSRLPIDPQARLTIEIIDDHTDLSADSSVEPESIGLSKPTENEPGNGTDRLIYRKLRTDFVTKTETQSGQVAIVGTGPGAEEWLSPQARQKLETATDWVGYTTYLNLAERWRKSHTVRHDSDNRVELDRARFALDLAAQGKRVAIVSSGDPGIYAMAAAVFEVMEREAKPEWAAIDLEVCPGISAMQAAAAAVGAPLGHDFCAISLSDLLKPWDAIAQRIEAAARADFVIAFYNPISSQRTWQLAEAKTLLLQCRSPETPVILAKNVGRSGQTITVTSLGEIAINQADMRTIVLIGSSKTRCFQQNDQQTWVYTPRFYGA